MTSSLTSGAAERDPDVISLADFVPQGFSPVPRDRELGVHDPDGGRSNVRYPGTYLHRVAERLEVEIEGLQVPGGDQRHPCSISASRRGDVGRHRRRAACPPRSRWCCRASTCGATRPCSGVDPDRLRRFQNVGPRLLAPSSVTPSTTMSTTRRIVRRAHRPLLPLPARPATRGRDPARAMPTTGQAAQAFSARAACPGPVLRFRTGPGRVGHDHLHARPGSFPFNQSNLRIDRARGVGAAALRGRSRRVGFEGVDLDVRPRRRSRGSGTDRRRAAWSPATAGAVRGPVSRSGESRRRRSCSPAGWPARRGRRVHLFLTYRFDVR